jgi:NAD(P)-dependent dehydrogenase (short-subunit alcohol dehydrogenase family)
MFRLDGKVSLVTGAASGIGAAIAEAFACAGAVVYIADRDFEGAQRQCDQIILLGGDAKAVCLDVTSEEHCERCAEIVTRLSGRLDILLNNAGIGAVGTLLQAKGEDLDRLFKVNVRGAFNVTKVFLPGMIERREGNIINMASVGGIVGIRHRLAYCTSKFAVVGFTKSMALDHAEQGIRVNCICPGRVETPFVTARLKEYADPVAARAEMSKTQLFGRMIRPEEIASAALYLASTESQMITGTTFMVDCGWTAGK